jgi:hypothetical protein
MLLLFAAEASSPLRLLPGDAQAMLHVPRPRALAENVVGHKLWARAWALEPFQEQLESTSFRRVRQVIEHFEKALGAKWPALLDDLAGHGIALAARQGDRQPFLVVAQGRDEKRQAAFAAKLVEVIESATVAANKSEAHGMPVWAFGDGLFLARAGAALIVGNRRDAVTAALGRARDGGKKSLAEHPHLVEMAKLLPEDALARAWLDMRPVQSSPEGKRAYADPRDDFLQTLFFGSYLSVLGRTPFVCAGLLPEAKGFRVSLRAPRGLDGMGGDRWLHVPLDGGAIRGLLEPEGVIYSLSFWLDFANIWKRRDKVFNAEQARGLEEASRNPAFAAFTGSKLSALFESVGGAHRFVAINQAKAGYRKQPRTLIPAFALVISLRDAEKGGAAFEAAIRATSFFFVGQLKMVRKEEDEGGVKVHGYRFSEREPLEGDAESFRYNFSPAWVRVGDQLALASTMEAARSLVPLLQKESEVFQVRARARAFDRVYASGLAALMETHADTLTAQAVLERAVPPAGARREVSALTSLVKSLGGLGTTSIIGKDTWQLDLWLRVE